MTLHRITTGSISRAASGALRYTVGGWKRILRIKRLAADGVTWRDVATFSPPMTASASPLTVSGVAISPTPVTITTNSTVASPTGGLGPYFYAWAVLTPPSMGTFSILSPAMATTAFRLTGVLSGSDDTAVVRCTITDTFGQTATVDVVAAFSNIDIS